MRTTKIPSADQGPVSFIFNRVPVIDTGTERCVTTPRSTHSKRASPVTGGNTKATKGSDAIRVFELSVRKDAKTETAEMSRRCRKSHERDWRKAIVTSSEGNSNKRVVIAFSPHVWTPPPSTVLEGRY